LLAWPNHSAKEGLKQVLSAAGDIASPPLETEFKKSSAGRRTDPDRFAHGPMRQPAAEAAAGEIQLVIDQARHSLDTSLDHSDDPHGPVIQMRHGQQCHAVALVSDGDAPPTASRRCSCRTSSAWVRIEPPGCWPPSCAAPWSVAVGGSQQRRRRRLH
jgi:hypothetical protein